MVVFHYKKGDGNQFLYQTTAQTSIDDLVVQICESKYQTPYQLILTILDQFAKYSFILCSEQSETQS